jgi:hypothetical protein
MLPILRRLAIRLVADQSATPLEYAQHLFVRLVAALARRSPAQLIHVRSDLEFAADQIIDDW